MIDEMGVHDYLAGSALSDHEKQFMTEAEIAQHDLGRLKITVPRFQEVITRLAEREKEQVDTSHKTKDIPLSLKIVHLVGQHNPDLLATVARQLKASST
jgi:hypothetical protein